MSRLSRGAWCVLALAVWLPGSGVATIVDAAQRDAAHDFPNKPIRFIAPFVAGAGTDITARTVAQKLTERVGHQVIVDNRPGAAGSIGVDLTAKATPDGYTVSLISASHSVNAAINPKLPYELTRDLQAVSQMTSLGYLLVVHPSVPVKSVMELVAYAKANPGKLNYGSSGTGGLSHFAGTLFGYMSGTDLVHVPYKGGAAALNDLLGGRTQIQFATLLGTRSHIQAGRLRALAISTLKRSPAAPDIPTVSEAGLSGYEVNQWYGVVTSAKVPRAIVNKLAAEISASVHSPDVAQRLSSDGSMPVGSKPEEFGAHIRAEIAKWRKLVKDAGLRLQ
ncbi:MAG: tripartite tricarboxylate transporter substrate binding protein [Betaproteobacteria bacterium]|nr:tripartite tricarboxylate transporter substrate binding protein [Betaproteobacteria bacterium]